jgi:hypothetical protein
MTDIVLCLMILALMLIHSDLRDIINKMKDEND